LTWEGKGEDPTAALTLHHRGEPTTEKKELLNYVNGGFVPA
jgi:hypothetical protein